jgi:4'-phosphopantetheinyl transferase
MTVDTPAAGVPVGLVLVEASDVPSGEGWLHPGERRVASGLFVPKRREEWLLGRWAAKRAVAAFLDVDAGSVSVVAASDGAPEARVGPDPARCVLSLSHREGWALCAVARPGVALGCDLEVVEARSEGFVQDFLTADEARAVRGAESAEHQDLLANIAWSAKEAVLKARRTGLRADTRSVAVDLPPAGRPPEGEWASLAARADVDGDWRGWWTTRGLLLLVVAARPDPAPPHELGPDSPARESVTDS